jgi:hypothetical protein
MASSGSRSGESARAELARRVRREAVAAVVE